MVVRIYVTNFVHKYTISIHNTSLLMLITNFCGFQFCFLVLLLSTNLLYHLRIPINHIKVLYVCKVFYIQSQFVVLHVYYSYSETSRNFNHFIFQLSLSHRLMLMYIPVMIYNYNFGMAAPLTSPISQSMHISAPYTHVAIYSAHIIFHRIFPLLSSITH